MTLPISGTLSAAQINVELGRAANAPFSLGGTQERGLAGKATGNIAFSDFHGKSSIIREPETGEYYTKDVTCWLFDVIYAYEYYVYWQGQLITSGYTEDYSAPTQVTVGGWTYYRGMQKSTTNVGRYYGVWRAK